MPRVNLNQTERENRRFSDYVRGQLARTGTKQITLAEYIGITQQGLSLRMIGRISWKLPEVIDVCDYFGESYTIGAKK